MIRLLSFRQVFFFFCFSCMRLIVLFVGCHNNDVTVTINKMHNKLVTVPMFIFVHYLLFLCVLSLQRALRALKSTYKMRNVRKKLKISDDFTKILKVLTSFYRVIIPSDSARSLGARWRTIIS